ncbi:MAG: TonB-dependent receptor [Calditrichaeota bacterium]|nr:MAG: TonB-dependent receptor [Calditrichota bacterium]MBL1204767.1 TonB-dependent receptor [Calditrichota bacterium]NOG44595.1 TonB-dependent receptor [Calditrichota bacterium]
MKSIKMQSFIISLIVFLTSIVNAGTTGKIAGRVIDMENKEPLPGANIIIQGTYLGAAADIDGNYTILNVQPGTYTLEIIMVGFAPVLAKDVIVKIDQTTEMNFELQATALEGEAVIVVAQRDFIKDDVATSVVSVSAEEINALPVSSIENVVELQAGVQEGFEIRGGSADEMLFNVDGLTLRDPGNNKPITSLALSAVEEVAVERGGFNAEYGQVRSGIVNVVTREGDRQDYYFSSTIKYSPPSKKYFGISPFSANSMWNRPFLDPDVAFVGTQNGPWDEYTRRQYPTFDGWNNLSERQLTNGKAEDDVFASPLALQQLWKWQRRQRAQNDEADYITDIGFGGPVPFAESLGNLRFFASYRFEREMLMVPLSRDDFRDQSFSLKLTSDIQNNMKLTISALAGTNYNVPYNQQDGQFLSDFPSWGPPAGSSRWDPTLFIRSPLAIATNLGDQRSGRLFVNSWYSQAVVEHSAISAKLTHTINSSSYYDASFDVINRKYRTGPIRDRDYTKRFEIAPGFFVDETPFGFSGSLEDTGVDGMFTGGHTGQARDSSNVSSYALKFDYSNQINFENLLKMGFDFSYYDLDMLAGWVNYGLGAQNISREKVNPYKASFYVQDKFETNGYIINLGLRMDISNPNKKWIDVDRYDEYFEDGNLEQVDKKDAKVDIAFSPRLGISHPVSENSKLFFNYGHFKQMPAYDRIFNRSRSTTGTIASIGNPNLIQAKTISYELGYDHLLFDDYLLQMAAYYHDITDQEFRQTSSDGNNINYENSTNNGYEDIRGLELTFRKSGGKWWNAFANYTYEVISTGHFGKDRYFESITEQRNYDRNTRDQEQDKPLPRPRANLGLSFFTPADFGDSYFGINPLSEWHLNFIANWKAGEFITYAPKGGLEAFSNLQVTDHHNLRLRLHKSFRFNKLKVTFFTEVDNLLNHKRLSGAGFYDDFDYQFYMESLHLPKSKFYDNIEGDDRPGDYRKSGVAFQPIEIVSTEDSIIEDTRAIFYLTTDEKYYQRIDNEVVEVSKSKMDKILKNKAYIDMPNQTSFNFLNPRQIFFGLTLSYEL